MNKYRLSTALIGSLLLLSLAACGADDTGPSSSLGPAPEQSVTSRFFPGTPSHIETVIIDPLPVENARLVTADGTMIVAMEILREKNAYTDQGDQYPHVALGAQGGSQTRVTTGIGIEFPFFGGGGGSSPRAVSMTTSTITFRVPDLAVYDETWQHWLLHVELGDGANHRTIETLPPKPPR